jgi:hypothetical protein
MPVDAVEVHGIVAWANCDGGVKHSGNRQGAARTFPPARDCGCRAAHRAFVRTLGSEAV